MTRPVPSRTRMRPAKATGQGIDPRGPRFGAGITAVLLIVVIGLALGQDATPPTTGQERATQPSFILFAAITLLFAWGTFAGVTRHPYGLLFSSFVRPRLAVATHLEDPRPPTFSQGVGLVVTLIGVALHLSGVPFGLVIFAAAAVIAAFLNSVFDYCLGCQLYLLLVRAGLIRLDRTARA
jgi:hypothetical protein